MGIDGRMRSCAGLRGRRVGASPVRQSAAPSRPCAQPLWGLAPTIRRALPGFLSRGQTHSALPAFGRLPAPMFVHEKSENKYRCHAHLAPFPCAGPAWASCPGPFAVLLSIRCPCSSVPLPGHPPRPPRFEAFERLPPSVLFPWCVACRWPVVPAPVRTSTVYRTSINAWSRVRRASTLGVCSISRSRWGTPTVSSMGRIIA